MADLLSKFRTSLNKSLGGDSWLTKDIGTLFSGEKLRDDALEELETRLLMADAGLEATQWLLDRLQAEIGAGRIKTEKQLREQLKKALLELLQPIAKPLKIPAFIRPYILFVVGVNGVGKTTTIGKLASRFKKDGLSVLLAAGDTFRAAAVQQLTTWSERSGVPILSQGEGADSASVIFDAVQSAKARGLDMVIADTAGRLHTQHHLMDELRKIKRVIQKHDAYAPHEVLLVVDATTGQNALNQAIQFHEAIGLTGIAVTKLDGTAKGGILLAIARRMALPIRYVGLGEAVDDLEVFDAEIYVESLIGSST
ncbi:MULTISPECIES: signal recognition particle-docking protein FtsY [Hydrocarboniphaga]|jgi:fused signal recognition particle receptor|uniref:Signal recognition particle receptor FtsY n=1 Tax=Hydrocarboniphaga effusa AP103 TaxID=1172194 RepID=I8TD67_9GAMM|nr:MULTISPECIES: signal recognition particle-docking protein FtsY [Hydrocarboniphaga]EIT71638.1 signal recognition particle-docking protein FtsY [Hydrocarboniphaga effusa AP103]MDZ4080265.1 signal recognition particle-docking protein FtsY [Hydrocarboniphaga sp.]